MRALEWAGGVGVGAFALIALGYVLLSFAFARAHHDPSPPLTIVRAALGELAVVLLSQPLVVPYFFLGHRMGGRAGGVPVVFVHGYFQNRADFVYVARALRRRGLGPLFAMNYWTFGRIEASAARLARFVERVREETGAEKVDLVCHSLGGLVAGEYLRSHPHDVRRCATLASPHAGVAWRGPILGKVARIMRRGSRYVREATAEPFSVPVLSVYSTYDNVVYPAETSALEHRGGKDLALPHVGHLAILFDARAAHAVAEFLAA